VPLVVRLFEPLSVTDDRPVAAKRAKAREQIQRDLGHPGSVLFSGSGSAIKRTTAGVKAERGPSYKFDRVASLHPPGKSISNEKRIPLSAQQRTLRPQIARLAGILADIGSQIGLLWTL
jgi:hypothetical protein